MRRVLCLLVALGAVSPAPALAEDLGPTPAELTHARTVAAAYWQTPVEPPIVMAELPEGAGQANYTTGSIELSSTHDWRDFPERLCMTVVHEEGHLILGPTYFASVNPADPAHSPDPNNVMYATGGSLAAAKTTGCYEAPPLLEQRGHFRRHRKSPLLAGRHDHRNRLRFRA